MDNRIDSYITNVIPILYEMLVAKITAEQCKEQLDELIHEYHITKEEIDKVGFLIAHKMFELI